MVAKRLFWVALLAALVISPLTAVAGVYDNLLSGRVTWLEDNDAEGGIDITSPIIGDGDLLIAIAEFPVFQATDASNQILFSGATRMATAISLIKVSSVTVTGTTASYIFEAPTALEWASAIGGGGFTVPYLPTGDNTMLLMFDDAPSTPHIDATGTIQTGVNTASNGPAVYEFGDTSATAFWTASTSSTTDPTNILAIDTLNFNAALDLINNFGGPELGVFDFLSVASGSASARAQFAAAGPKHIQLSGSNQQGLPVGGPDGFALSTDTDFFVFAPAVPEASTVVIWSGLALVGGLLIRRAKIAHV